MRTAIGIFWHDLKQVFSNPIAFALILGVLLLPSAFAWYSISAMWSPYQNTDGIRVAVVDNDEGAQSSAVGELDVGALVTQAIGSDRRLSWDVVSADEGRKGLESGEYYAQIIIPPGFSQQFCNVLDGKMGDPTIEYWVNQKHGAAASETADDGAGVVDMVINRAFSALVAESIGDVAAQAAAKASEGDAKKADSEKGESKVQDSLDKALTRLGNMETNFKDTNESIEKWRETVKTAQESLDSLSESIPDTLSTITSTTDLLADVRDSSQKANDEYSGSTSDISKEVVSSIQSVVDRVGKLADSISSSSDELASAADQVQGAIDRNEQIIEELEAISDPSAEVKSAIESLKEKNEELRASAEALSGMSDTVADAVSQADDIVDTATSDVESVLEGADEVEGTLDTDVLPKLESAVDSIAVLLGTIQGAVNGLDTQVTQASDLLDELDSVFNQSEDVLTQTADSVDAASSSLDSARTSLTAIADSEFIKKAAELAGVDVNTYANYMAAPVSTKVEALYSKDSYGAMASPFYTNLAIWVAALMLVLLIRADIDPRRFPNVKPWQGYLGRLLLLVVFALLQSVVVCVGDLVLGIGATHPVAFIGAGLMCAFAFTGVVYALSAVFKNIGKALAVILLIVQIPGASGMFPVGLLPDFFQGIYPLLPFTYGMGAMREAIGGFYGNAYAIDMLWLIVSTLIVTALALLVRPQLFNVGRMFDNRLTDADVFETDASELGAGGAYDRAGMRAPLTREQLSIEAVEEARSYERFYHKFKRVLPAIVVLVPVLLIVFMALSNVDANGKVLMLVVLVVALVALFCIVVGLEYVHDNFMRLLEAARAYFSGGRRGTPAAAAVAAPVAAAAAAPVAAGQAQPRAAGSAAPPHAASSAAPSAERAGHASRASAAVAVSGKLDGMSASGAGASDAAASEDLATGAKRSASHAHAGRSASGSASAHASGAHAAASAADAAGAHADDVFAQDVDLPAPGDVERYRRDAAERYRRVAANRSGRPAAGDWGRPSTWKSADTGSSKDKRGKGGKR